jgi:hypothetical protein
MIGITPEYYRRMALAMAARGAKIPHKPSILERRETCEIEPIPYEPGGTNEFRYHKYSNGSMYSFHRYKSADGYVRVSVMQLSPDVKYGQIRHMFDNSEE